MPQNEADRIIKQRIQQRELDAKNAQEQHERDVQLAVESLRTEPREVLRLLAENGYPGVQELHINEGIFRRNVVKAGWTIGQIGATPSFDERRSLSYVYLISDGNLACDTDGEGIKYVSPEKLREMMFDGSGAISAYKGLQALRQNLQRNTK